METRTVLLWSTEDLAFVLNDCEGKDGWCVRSIVNVSDPKNGRDRIALVMERPLNWED